MTSLIVGDSLTAKYGKGVALRGVGVRIDPGEVVQVIGANGAGKSTLLKTMFGVVPLSDGEIVYRGASISRMKAWKRLRLGIAHVPEGRRIVGEISVEENLAVIADAVRTTASERAARFEQVWTIFPILKEFRRRPGGQLSGGQQQMLAIARAMMAKPDLILLDEPTLGLSPRAALELWEAVDAIAAAGTAFLIAEQGTQWMNHASRVYVIRQGEVVLESSVDPSTEARVRESYFG